jgi:pyruvate/2-oxoglutarate dehydrogenase complex dihydrolipoamide acyltransferase (E2) component
MRNVDLGRLERPSDFRRLAVGSWHTAYDPSIYGAIDVRMESALAYMDAFHRRTGRRLTVTHLVTRAVAMALRRCPEANAVLRWSRVHLRRRIDVSVLVLQPRSGDLGPDLAACIIRDADQGTLAEFVADFDLRLERVRSHRDEAMAQGKRTLRRVPMLLMGAVLRLVSFVSYTLNWNLRAFGVPRDPFGGATVTNVGSLGLDTAFVPLVPYTRVPFFVAPGEIREVPVVAADRVVPGKVMRLCATLDHRIIDGAHARVLAQVMRECLERPFEHLDRIDDLPAG